MKTLLIGLMALAATLATAEPGKNEPAASTTTSTTTAAKKRSDSTIVSSTKPNQIRHGRVTYSGAVVTAIKVKNPLQLINPFAPMAYGSGEDNVCRDSSTGRARGINVLSVNH